ncbi:DUF1643 domain-containing protein [Nodularia harveyana UHCC-0300]|uniref:DUF1643 domain-containing protein n=1 Tax=Nodularia harveyana UHCC-0300 TaxID=2974287 RepID=A0ABU5UJH2_9CYAN|nr:DUF1643 domain-containing protein [Nodularia harveyana]MEA5583230.1 DUF1643 domain-containing protein [Nodularia harveyana UHCC-0300]
MEKYATIDGNYRYVLGRKWDKNLQQVTFVMLNPSIADQEKDDPTLRKCINFAKSWGYGSLEVVNLFAYIATNPRELRQVDEPVGKENNHYLELAINNTSKIILAWGTKGNLKKRDQEVINLISVQKPLYCLGITKYGYPRHPLYLKKNTQAIIFSQN